MIIKVIKNPRDKMFRLSVGQLLEIDDALFESNDIVIIAGGSFWANEIYDYFSEVDEKKVRVCQMCRHVTVK